MAKQCPCFQKYKKCQGSHHSLLHKEFTMRSSRSGQSLQCSLTREDPSVVTTHTSQSGRQRQVSLMTCQVIAVRHDGTSICLVYFGASCAASPPTVKPVHSGGKTHEIDALLIRTITSNIPSCSVTINKDWKHLSNLILADLGFGVPGSVDILLSANVLSRTVFHGWRFVTSGSPSAIRTTFGWVLAGSV